MIRNLLIAKGLLQTEQPFCGVPVSRSYFMISNLRITVPLSVSMRMVYTPGA